MSSSTSDNGVHDVIIVSKKRSRGTETDHDQIQSTSSFLLSLIDTDAWTYHLRPLLDDNSVVALLSTHSIAYQSFRDKNFTLRHYVSLTNCGIAMKYINSPLIVENMKACALQRYKPLLNLYLRRIWITFFDSTYHNHIACLPSHIQELRFDFGMRSDVFRVFRDAPTTLPLPLRRLIIDNPRNCEMASRELIYWMHPRYSAFAHDFETISTYTIICRDQSFRVRCIWGRYGIEVSRLKRIMQSLENQDCIISERLVIYPSERLFLHIEYECKLSSLDRFDPKILDKMQRTMPDVGPDCTRYDPTYRYGEDKKEYSPKLCHNS